MEGTQHISQRYWSQRPLLVPLNSKLAQCGTIMDLTAVDTTLVSCTRYKKCNNMPVQRQIGSWRSLPIESEIPRESILFSDYFSVSGYLTVLMLFKHGPVLCSVSGHKAATAEWVSMHTCEPKKSSTLYARMNRVSEGEVRIVHRNGRWAGSKTSSSHFQGVTKNWRAARWYCCRGSPM